MGSGNRGLASEGPAEVAAGPLLNNDKGTFAVCPVCQRPVWNGMALGDGLIVPHPPAGDPLSVCDPGWEGKFDPVTDAVCPGTERAPLHVYTK